MQATLTSFLPLVLFLIFYYLVSFFVFVLSFNSLLERKQSCGSDPLDILLELLVSSASHTLGSIHLDQLNSTCSLFSFCSLSMGRERERERGMVMIGEDTMRSYDVLHTRTYISLHEKPKPMHAFHDAKEICLQIDESTRKV